MDPKVTPYLMSVADGCCSRWLQATFENEATLPEPFLRGRIRDPLMRWLSEGHQDGGSPSIELLQVPEQLLPEEVFYLRKFAKNYLRIFVDRPGSTVDHDLKYPTDFLRRKLRVGGWVDLLSLCVNLE